MNISTLPLDKPKTRPQTKHSLLSYGLLGILFLILVQCGKETTVAGGSGTETTDEYVIAGKAIYPDGNPVPNAAVLIRSQHKEFDQYDLPGDFGSPLTDTVKTDANGKYQISLSKLGQYSIEIKDGKQKGAYVSTELFAEDTLVTIPVTTLSPLGSISGQVLVDSTALLQNEKVKVKFWINSLGRSVEVDSVGQFQMGLIPPGEYTVQFVPSALYLEAPVQKVLVSSGKVSIVPQVYLKRWDTGWNNYLKISLNTTSTGVYTPVHVWFLPLLLKLDSSNFNFSGSTQDGRDLRFAMEDGRPLPYHITQWDSANKKGEVWVRVFNLLPNNNQQYIKLYYGNSLAKPQSNSTDVFKAKDGYLGVWHLDEKSNASPGNFKDVSAAENHLTGKNFNASNSAVGIIGSSVYFDGKDQFLEALSPLLNGLNEFMICAWVNFSEQKSQYVFGQKGVGEVYLDSTNNIYFWTKRSKNLEGEVKYQNNSWHFIAVTARDSSQTVYFDNDQVNSNTNSSGSYGNSSNSFQIGMGHPNKNLGYFHGKVDAVMLKSSTNG